MWTFSRRTCLVIVGLVKLANKVDIDDETGVVGTRLKGVSDSTFVFDDVVAVVDADDDDDEGSTVYSKFTVVAEDGKLINSVKQQHFTRSKPFSLPPQLLKKKKK